MNHNAVNLISPTDCVERENVYCSACLKQWHASTRVEGKRKRGVRVAGRRDACVNLRFIALATATLIVVPFSLSHRAQSPFHLSLSTYGYSHFPFLPTSVSVPLVAFLPSTQLATSLSSYHGDKPLKFLQRNKWISSFLTRSFPVLVHLSLSSRISLLL